MSNAPQLFAFCAFALEFAVELAFGLAQFAGEALEGFLFVDAGFGLEAGYAGGDRFPGLRIQTWGTRFGSVGGRFDEQGEFAADAVAGGEVAAYFGDGAAEKFFVELGEFAGDDDAQRGSPDGFEIGERVDDAVRRLVEDQRLRGIARLAQRGLRGACGGRLPSPAGIRGSGIRRWAGRRR